MSSVTRRLGGLDDRPAQALGGSSFGLETLVELFEGDAGAILDLLDAAQLSIRRDLETIVILARAGDIDPIIEAAHRIRGTSGSIGAGTLVEVSARIQAAVSGPAPQLAPSLIAALSVAVEAVCADIAAYARTSVG